MLSISQYPPPQYLCHVLECFLYVHSVLDVSCIHTKRCTYKEVQAQCQIQNGDNHIECSLLVVRNRALVLVDFQSEDQADKYDNSEDEA